MPPVTYKAAVASRRVSYLISRLAGPVAVSLFRIWITRHFSPPGTSLRYLELEGAYQIHE